MVGTALTQRLMGTHRLCVFGGGEVGGWRCVGSPQALPVEIVGVARDVVRNKIGEVPEPFLYLPFGQHIQGEMTLLVETKGNASPMPGLIRREMRLLNDKVLFFLVETQKEVVRTALFLQWTLAWLMAGLGLAAFAIAAAGLYGLVSYSVARRTHEIGVRMALGAQTADTLRMILRQGADSGAPWFGDRLTASLPAGPDSAQPIALRPQSCGPGNDSGFVTPGH